MRSQSRRGLPFSSKYFALAMRFSSEILTPEEQTMSQRWQPIQRSIHLSTEGSLGLRNRSAPGPACLGPGNCGVTRETGQTAIQVAQRIQTSKLFLGQVSFFTAIYFKRCSVGIYCQRDFGFCLPSSRKAGLRAGRCFEFKTSSKNYCYPPSSFTYEYLMHVWLPYSL